jgi:hypothetical protein
MPTITESYEVGYEYRQKTTNLQATLFYRDKSNLFTQVNQDIGGDVLLSTWENLGREHDVGLELVANRELVRNVTFNGSADLMQSEVDAQNLGIAGVRKAFLVTTRMSLSWQISPNDFIQFGDSTGGRQLTAQGFRGGAIFSNLGWRHRFDSRLAAVLAADNPFGLSRRTIETDTPTLVEIDKRKFNDVAMFLGLTYALGAAPQRAGDNFDFGAKGEGAP